MCLIYFIRCVLKGSPEKAAQLYKRANDIRENEPRHGLSRRSSLSVLSNSSVRRHSQSPQTHDSVSRVIALWYSQLILKWLVIERFSPWVSIIASSRRSVSWGAAQKTVRKKCFMIGLKLAPLFHPITRFLASATCFDWFVGFSVSFVIGWSDYFWFYDTRLKTALAVFWLVHEKYE